MFSETESVLMATTSTVSNDQTTVEYIDNTDVWLIVLLILMCGLIIVSIIMFKFYQICQTRFPDTAKAKTSLPVSMKETGSNESQDFLEPATVEKTQVEAYNYIGTMNCLGCKVYNESLPQEELLSTGKAHNIIKPVQIKRMKPNKQAYKSWAMSRNSDSGVPVKYAIIGGCLTSGGHASFRSISCDF